MKRNRSLVRLAAVLLIVVLTALMAGCDGFQFDGNGSQADVSSNTVEVLLSGVEADSIQYFDCTKPVDFCVIEKDGKFGLINYSGEIILPIQYKSIELFEVSPYNPECRLYAYDTNGVGYWIRQNGALFQEQRGGWGYGEESRTVYWYNGEPALFDNYYGKIEYSYEGYASYPHGAYVLGQITNGTADVIPVQQISSYGPAKEFSYSAYSVELLSEKYALLNLKTRKLVTNFVFDKYDYSGVVEGIIPMKKGDKWGYVKDTGEAITEFIYDASSTNEWGVEYIYSAQNGYIVVRQGDKWGLIYRDGSTAIEVDYEAVSHANATGKVWLKKDGLWSLYKINK